MRNSCPRMEGSGRGFWKGGALPPLFNSAALKARAVLGAWGCRGKQECSDVPPFYSA